MAGIIRIEYEGRWTKSVNCETITTGSVNTVTAEFQFDSTWSDFPAKTAIFANGSLIKRVPLNTENSCIVPWEVLERDGVLELGVVGQNGDKIMPSVKATVRIFEGIYTKGTEPEPPTPGIYEMLVKIQQQIGDLAALDTEAKNNLVTAINEVFSGTPGENTDKNCSNIWNVAITDDGYFNVSDSNSFRQFTFSEFVEFAFSKLGLPTDFDSPDAVPLRTALEIILLAFNFVRLGKNTEISIYAQLPDNLEEKPITFHGLLPETSAGYTNITHFVGVLNNDTGLVEWEDIGMTAPYTTSETVQITENGNFFVIIDGEQKILDFDAFSELVNTKINLPPTDGVDEHLPSTVVAFVNSHFNFIRLVDGDHNNATYSPVSLDLVDEELVWHGTRQYNPDGTGIRLVNFSGRVNENTRLIEWTEESSVSIGDIETALDEIIAIKNSLIGGESV